MSWDKVLKTKGLRERATKPDAMASRVGSSTYQGKWPPEGKGWPPEVEAKTNKRNELREQFKKANKELEEIKSKLPDNFEELVRELDSKKARVREIIWHWNKLNEPQPFPDKNV